MNKHHNHTSFRTFAKHTLGFNKLSDSQLEGLEGELSVSYTLSEENPGLQSTVILSSAKGDINVSQPVQHPQNEGSSWLLSQLSDNAERIQQALTKLQGNSESADTQSVLLGLAQVFSQDYGLEKLYAQQVIDIVLKERVVECALPQLTELMIVLGQEQQLALFITNKLPTLINNSAFLALPENLRLIQQLLAPVSDNTEIKKTLSEWVLFDGEEQLDAQLSIWLTASRTSDEFISFVNRPELKERLLQQQYFQRLIDTLSRSPVKINFIAGTPLFSQFWQCVDENKHVSMLFRALYFIGDDLRNALDHVDIVKVLFAAFSMEDAGFNIVYRDIRRSNTAICSREELEQLLERLNTDELSLNKWIYLFSLLGPHIDEDEKLRFLTRVMIMKGMPAINSEIPLTFSAALGLKALSNEIINDFLAASNCIECLPTSNDYTLKDIFSSVLSAGQEASVSPGDKELVTVIITTFNPDLTFLSMSLQSLALQTYKNIEVIVVDDKSEESTSQQIADLCGSYKNMRVKFLRNSHNVGQYVSRNIAISQSKGSIIAIQDDDDVSHPQRIELQVRALEVEGYSACFTKHVRYSDEGVLSVDDPRNLLVLGDGPASLMFKRDVIDIVGGFRAYRSRGDIDFRARIQRLLGEKAIKHLDMPLYYMRSSLTTISSLYEYLHGDQLVFFRKRIEALSGKAASPKECGVE